MATKWNEEHDGSKHSLNFKEIYNFIVEWLNVVKKNS